MNSYSAIYGIRTILASVIIFLSLFGNAQTPEIDSVKGVIAKMKEDSNKVNSILFLAKQYFSEDPNLAIQYSREGLELTEKINYPRGKALSFKQIGIGFYMQSNYVEAIENWNKALAEYKKMKDKAGEANILSNLGAIYFNQADDIKALDNYLIALKIAEEINDSLRLATVLNNIGSVYKNKDETYEKALEYYHRALLISDAIKNEDAIGMANSNIGFIYFEMKQYEKALKYLEQSLIAFQESENIVYSYITIGKVYTKKEEYDKAIDNLDLALNISKDLNIKLGMARALMTKGDTYRSKGDIRSAIKNYIEGIEIAREIEANIDLKEMYGGISKCYEKTGEYSKAFYYQGLQMDMKDSLFTQETDKKLSTLMFNYEIEKKENRIQLLTKDAKIKQQSLQRQKLIRNTFIAGFLVVMAFAGVFFRQRNRISKEKQRSEELLLNILPDETAEELKNTGTAKAKSFDLVTVLFTDFKDFTKVAERLNPKDLVNEINECFSAFDRIMEQYGIEKIKTIGDAYMAAGGLPTPNTTNPEDVVNAALAIRKFMQEYEAKKIEAGEEFFRIRIGIHTGPVVAGIVGVKKFAYDIWGDTVNTSSRMESSGEADKINISGSTYELVKDKFQCTYRGKLEAKNKGAIDMYFVEGPVS
jgi:class 3 adenylate cyclase/Tfp pilus assembly protein PilF